MTTWFTADQHVGPARILELSAARGAAFSSIAEMNARLVHHWNPVAVDVFRGEPGVDHEPKAYARNLAQNAPIGPDRSGDDPRCAHNPW